MNRFRCVYVLALLLTLPLLFSCGGGGGSEAGIPGPPPGSKDPADIVASVRYQAANITYSQSASIIAKVFDYNGDPVADGTPVRFSVNLNNVTKTTLSGSFRFSNGQTTFDTTTINGFCTAVLSYVGVLTEPSAAATVTIQPLGFIQIYENVGIVFFSNASVSFALILTTDSSTIPGDGFSSTKIHAKIINVFGVPPQSSIEVTFSNDPSDVGNFDSDTALTDENGEATVIFRSTTVTEPISVLITATATVPVSGFLGGVSVSDIISVGLTPQVISSITVTAEPTTIYTYGTEDDSSTPNNSTITAKVDDENGYPLVDNTLVKFTARDRDTGEPIGIIDPFALTQDGVATVELKAGFKAGIAEITATDSSETVSGTVFVVIKTDLDITNSPPDGTVGETYFFAFLATGGVEPYTWRLVSGSLPSGLELSQNGVISGIPEETGTFIFEVEVEDAFGNTVSESFSIDIAEGGTT